MMHNFFTPVQVVRAAANVYSRQDLNAFDDSLFTMTLPRIRSLSDERKEISLWLRSLPSPLRQRVLCIRSPEFVCLLRKFYQEWHTKGEWARFGVNVQEGELTYGKDRCYKPILPRDKLLVGEIRLVTEGQLFQALTLSEQILNDIDKLFELLDAVRGGVVYEFAYFTEEELKRSRLNFEKDAIGSDPKTISEWLADMMLKQVALAYLTRHQSSSSQLDHSKQQEKDYTQLWRELSAEDRVQLVIKGMSRPPNQLMRDYDHAVAVYWKDLPTLYVEVEKDEAVKQLVNCAPKDFLSALTYCSLAQSLSVYSVYRVDLILEVEAKLVFMREKASKKKKQKKKKPAASIVKDKIAKSSQWAKNQEQIAQKEMSALSLQHSHGQSIENSAVRSANHTPENSKMSTPVKGNSPNDQTEQNISLEDFYRQIKENNRDRYRKIILNRMITLLGQLKLKCATFGSYAAQLSLPGSDLDIQVNSSLLSYFSFNSLAPKQQMIAALEFLRSLLQKHEWASQFVIYPNARLPILIFKADAGLHFDHGPETRTKLRVNGKRLTAGQAVVQVDLTLQPNQSMAEIPHFGLQSTQLVKKWLATMPDLQRLILVVKSLTRQAGLHKSYEGVSSFVLVMLVVSFLKEGEISQSLQDQLSALTHFLQRMIEEGWIIDFGRECVQKKGPQCQAGNPVLVSPFDRRNLLERCFKLRQLPVVLRQWRQLVVSDE